jgi:Ran GTPase-activating protein (RanGAP) involved in mRNA processing and transport
MEYESKQQIIERQKEIERELIEMLKKTKSPFSLEHIKDIVFHEKEQNDMTKIVAMFDRGGDISELSNILELASDAWNYFPHKILNGLSPAEKLLEYQGKTKK